MLRAALCAVSLMLAGGAVVVPPPASASAAPPANRTVTLITGDKVDIGDTVRLRPAKGREKISYVRRTMNGHDYVIPADALAMVTAGKLDSRLFDVQTLAAQGYDDSHRAELPLIVQSGSRAASGLAAVGMTSLQETKSAATSVWNSLVSGKPQHIWLDGKRQPLLDQSVPQIGAPIAWKAGFTGAGTVTAVLDTGIDATHPDFAGKIVASQNFTNDPDTDDQVGHGTHVASTITGSGAASGGRYQGVAPGTKLAVGKVCQLGGCEESAIIAGMVWAARTAHARVVNMSIGGPDLPGPDPVKDTLTELSAGNGPLFVVAAGNNGLFPTPVGSPASADAALAVGAVTKADVLSPVSSQGPRAGDGAVKPDIAAPGVDIVAAKARNGLDGIPSDNPRYVSMSGTSMAAPHVAGAAAIVAGEHPDWSGPQVKAALMAAAKPLPDAGVFGVGAGRVDVGRAVSQRLTANPPSVSFPVQVWPHTDDTPATKTVTYTNSGKTPLTLALSVDVRAPDSTPAPAGMFSVSPATLTLQSGANGQATVTTNTTLGSKDGNYTGAVVAAAGDQSVRTALDVNREVESHNLTVTTLNRQGVGARNHGVTVVGYDAGTTTSFVTDPVGASSTTIRLPKGRYAITDVVTDDGLTVDLEAPLVTMTRDITLVLDGRKSKQADIGVDNPAARVANVQVGSVFRTPMGRSDFGSGAYVSDPATLYTAMVGPPAPADLYTFTATSDLAEPGADGAFRDSPYVYQLAQSTPGRIPVTGIRIRPRTAALAAVQQQVLSTAPNRSISRSASLILPGEVRFPGFGIEFSSTKPGTVTRYLTPATVAWSLRTQQLLAGGAPEITQVGEPQVFPAGETRQVVDKPIFGPGFFPADTVTAEVSAQLPGGILRLAPRLFSDSSPANRGDAAGTGGSVLHQDGKKVAESDYPELIYLRATTAAKYRLESSVSQAFSPLSTKVSATWDFSSTPTPGALPLFALRFTPVLDDAGKAPAGTYQLPITVDRQLPSTTITAPTVDYSTDDGKTWKAAAIHQEAGRWTATVTNPSAGFVTLRASAAAPDSTTCSETITRAYAIA